MKLKLLIAFMALSLMSCSDDDDIPLDQQPIAEKKLDKIVESLYIGGSISKRTITQFNDNNQVVNEIEYDSSDIILVKREYIYDMSGLLKTQKIYYAGGGLEIPSYINNYFYDDAGRLIKNISTIAIGTPETTTTIYAYTSSTIIAKPTSNLFGVLPEAIYELNNEGLIVKRTANSSTDELIYEGINIVFYGGTSHSPAFEYEYDMVNQPVGQYVNILKNLYGSTNKAILMSDFGFVPLLSSNYLIKWSDNNGNLRYEFTYEFDEEGYPVIVKRYFAGIETPATIREISYQ